MTKTRKPFEPVVLVLANGDYVSRFGEVYTAWEDVIASGHQQEFIAHDSTELEIAIRRLQADGFGVVSTGQVTCV